MKTENNNNDSANKRSKPKNIVVVVAVNGDKEDVEELLLALNKYAVKQKN